MKEYNLESLEKFTSQVRRDIVRMVHAQNSDIQVVLLDV